MFVSDYSHDAVFKFQITNNKFVCQSAKGELNCRLGITVVTNGEVLVADCRNNRITILNSELKLVRKIGKDKLKYPQDVKINKNNIFAADNNEINNMHIFTESGDIIRSFIKLDNGRVDIHFCFDLYNNIIVSDYWSKSIQMYTINGELIHKIVCKSYPTGIAVAGYYLGARDAPLGVRFLRNFSLGVWKFGQLPIDVIQNHGFRRMKI